ncbi:MAG: alpha-amylase family glycosyl hydrolase [Lachnospiraceae bacterium]
MAWYDEAIFYHIYPLGLTGAPKKNPYQISEHRLNNLIPWISHMKELGITALYIGPLFESVGHGYETTDYKKLDSRLGDNEDLRNFVAECHNQDIKVIFDGVFNHTGRDFFAFQDIKKNRENSPYKDWYCNVNFWGNNEYNDGFSYDNWGGYNLLVKLNQHNPAVRDYICDVIRFWVKEFDVDGIRLDAADVLDFEYMRTLRRVANEVKPDFWLMGEVIHGDYSRWVNQETLHSVTNYHLHKALYSGHNDHNYFEIAHTVKRLYDMSGQNSNGFRLYNFVDNHDVERIYTKLREKAHFTPVHILLYTLPGIPSIYYGSEFGIEGRKERYSDDSLRPALHLEDFKDAIKTNPCTSLIAKLGIAKKYSKALSYGDYRELLLQTRQYAFSRNCDGESVIVTVNNDTSDYVMTIQAGNVAEYIGVLSGEKVSVNGGTICVNVRANSGDIWMPYSMELEKILSGEEIPVTKETEICEVIEEKEPEYAVSPEVSEICESTQTEIITEDEKEIPQLSETITEDSTKEETSTQSIVDAGTENVENVETIEDAETIEDTETKKKEPSSLELFEAAYDKAFEEGKIAGLQEGIIALMEKNGYINDQMRQDVYNNTHYPSLINWIKSFIR